MGFFDFLRRKEANYNTKRSGITVEEARRIRAGLQPLGFEDPVYGYMDESGDLGSSPRSSEALTTAVVTTPDPSQLRWVESRHIRNTRGFDGMYDESKFSTSIKKYRKAYLHDLMDTDSRLYAVTTFKEGDDEVPRSGPALLRDNALDVLSIASSSESRPIIMVFDEHTLLTEYVSDKICRNASILSGQPIFCLKYDGKSSEIPELSSPDMVAGSVRHRTRKEFDDAERQRYWRIIQNRAEYEER